MSVGLACLGWGFFFEPDELMLHTERVHIDGLPPTRIVVLGDIHGGARFIDRAKLDQAVALANAQHPDLVFLLGDFVTGHRGSDGSPAEPKMPPEEIAAALGKLTPRHGTFAVLGNHDFWFDAARVRDSLMHVGIRVLEDEAIPFPGSPTGTLVGLADQLEGHSDLGRALGGSRGAPNVVLVHEPDVFPELPSWASLTLAAHTHGGQVNLPLLGRPIVPSEFGQAYAAGWTEHGGKRLFVTTGIGTSIMPVRFRVPPEVVLLEVNDPPGNRALAPMPSKRLESAEVVDAGPPDPHLVSLFGVEGIELVKRATRVKSFRVNGSNARRNWGSQPPPANIGGYSIVKEGEDLNPALLERLRATLLSNSTYALKQGGRGFWATKLCGGFRPGVAFRFESDVGALRSLDVLLCFACNDVGVVADGKDLHPGVGGAGPGMVLTTDMSQARHRLLEISTDAFPRDADLEALLAGGEPE